MAIRRRPAPATRNCATATEPPSGLMTTPCRLPNYGMRPILWPRGRCPPLTSWACGLRPDRLPTHCAIRKACRWAPSSSGIAFQHATDHAFYAVVDQLLWKKPGADAPSVSVFLQAMTAPADRNLSNLFVAGGFNWNGPLPGRSKDAAGLAVTYAGIGNAARQFGEDVIFYTGSGSPYSAGETIVEATYRAQFAPWLILQPDLQYVVNPGAGIPTPRSSAPLKNARVIGTRLTITF